MGVRKPKKAERPIFDSIRKPTPPPGKKFGGAKSEERIHPSRRKAKHKEKLERKIPDGDL